MTAATPGQAAYEQLLSDYLRERGRPRLAGIIEDAERGAAPPVTAATPGQAAKREPRDVLVDMLWQHRSNLGDDRAAILEVADAYAADEVSAALGIATQAAIAAQDAQPAPGQLRALLEEALFLRQNGEHAPGGRENWRDWDDKTERFLRSLPPDAQDARPAPELAAYRDEMTRLMAERDRLAELVRRYERITTAWTRGMYSAHIDCVRGDVKAAIRCLSEGLDGYDGTEWNGTETGAEWWERTKAEEGL